MTAPSAAAGLEWIAKLQHLLLTLAICLTLSAVHYAVQPTRDYEIALAFSLSIGVLTWALIDFGRHLFPSADGIGWPSGLAAIWFPLLAIALGYAGGTLLAYHWLGLESWSAWGAGRWTTSIVLSLAMSVACTYYFYTRGKSAWMQARMTEAHGQATEARLKLLETQLEPHMLFNSLANLRVLIGTDPARAQDMLDRMIAYLRATLNASRSSFHPLGLEFERLRDYLEIMAVRMGPRLTYTLELPSALADVPVPPLLLQPLVENAIRHGLEPQIAGGKIVVRARAEAPDGVPLLVLEVSDTGVGLAGTGGQFAGGSTRPAPPANASAVPSRFGLAQVRERLATLHGAAGTLELIAKGPEETLARVTFPFKNTPPPP